MNLTENFSLSALPDRARSWWEQAPQSHRIGVGAGAAVLILALLFALSTVTTKEGNWEPAILYAELDYAEAAQVTTRLSALGIKHRLTEDASTIVVPKDDVRNLRLQLAGEGFPKSGRMGYEIFDEAKLSMTEFLQKVNLRRALQGELEKTLLEIEGIRNARLHLVIPEPSLFSEEEKEVTASVTLTLSPGNKLKLKQIDAIAHLVSASVEGLEVENVIIVDSQGNMLSDDQDLLAKTANKQFQLQQQVEQTLEKKVQSLLDEVIGKDRSKVRLNVTLTFDQSKTHLEQFDPGGTGMLRSEQTSEKQSAEQGSEETAIRNYEVNKTIREVTGSVGTIERLTMALTIDKTKLIYDAETDVYIEEERTQTEIDQLSRLAEGAVGFNGERGDRLNIFAMRFDKTQELRAREQEEQEETSKFWTDVGITVAKVLGILAALITLRFIIQAIGRGVGVEEQIEVLGEVAGDVDEQSFERPETPHDILVGRVQQMVRELPENSAKLIKTMLVEGG
ncbi:MAG: flagellar M-ring protein FliF [Candidatus Handelsmanbacteria bacterium]|nr:flagellar M-ring protein FliF [Candidatus Handelsmanbacteria bacterium]